MVFIDAHVCFMNDDDHDDDNDRDHDDDHHDHHHDLDHDHEHDDDDDDDQYIIRWTVCRLSSFRQLRSDPPSYTQSRCFKTWGNLGRRQ